LPVPVNGTCCGLLAALSVIVTSPVRVPFCVGVKVTFIVQVFPAAKVAPQGFVGVTKAKSPLMPMLLMFSVALPVFFIVMSFPRLVVPTFLAANVSEVGVSVTTGAEAPVTVRLTVVVAVKLPDVPVIVTVDVPVAADALAVSVNVLVVVVGFGTNPAVTPLGKPDALMVTLPAKPFRGFTVMVLVPLFPWAMLRLVGFADKVKLGPAAPASALIRAAPLGLPQPVTRS